MDDVKPRKAPDIVTHPTDPEALPHPPDSHPVGTGLGVLSGAAAGAAIGMAGGPVGAVVGGVLGAAAGGLAGKGIAELVNPADEEEHWRDAYVREPYFQPGQTYDYYASGYRTGWEGRVRYHGRDFADVEANLRAEYERARTEGAPDWREGRLAAKAAWDRITELTINAR